MSFSTRQRDDWIVMVVDGSFSECCEALGQEVLATVERGNRRVELDLRAVRLKSPDLAALLAIGQKVHERGGTFQVSADPALSNAFVILKLCNMLSTGPAEPGDDGLAGRLAPLRPAPPGPIEGKADADISSPD